jgi:hypothetical protein
MMEETGGRGKAPRAVLAFALLATLAITIPLLVVWFAPSDSRTAEAMVVWLIVAYSSARLSLLALRGEMRILSLTFWIFVYVWLGIAPFTQLMNNEFPLPGYYASSIVIFCVIIIGVGLLSFELGIQAAKGFRATSAGKPPLLRRSISTTRTIFLAALAVVLSSYLIWRLGGPTALLASRGDVFSTLASITGTESQEKLQLLYRSLRVPPYVTFYLLWWIWLRRRDALGSYEKLSILLLLGATALINALVNNPVNSARYWFGTIALSVAFISVQWRKNWSFIIWTIFLLAALILVFPYADIFRREIDTSNLYFEGLDPVVDEGHYDAFQQTMNAITYVEEEGPLYGRQMSGTLLFWVPRRLWADKPVPSGRMVGEYLGFRFTNISMPLWGEAYLDGALPFTALVFLLYGAFLGRAEQRFVDYVSRRRPTPELYAVAVPVLAAYQLFLLRGALMSCVAYLVPVVLLLFIASKFSESAESRMGGV